MLIPAAFVILASLAFADENTWPWDDDLMRDTISNLKDLDAAAPSSANTLNARIGAGAKMPTRTRITPPKDDDPPEKHLDWWVHTYREDKKQLPSPAAREKILAALEDDPSWLYKALPYLPATPEAAARVARILENLPGESESSRYMIAQVRVWIYQNSGLMGDAVIEDATNPHWSYYVKRMVREIAFDILWKREPEAAAKLCETLVGGKDSGIAALAGSFLHDHASAYDAPKWRDILIRGIADPAWADDAKQIAVNSLLAISWDGREKWIEETLSNSKEVSVYCFTEAIGKDLKSSLPALVRMAGSGNPLVRENALSLLVDCDTSRETLSLRLAALELNADGKLRHPCGRRFISTLTLATCPEAIPQLVNLLEKSEDEAIVGSVCEALAHQRARSAVPAMRNALERVKWEHQAEDVILSIQKLAPISSKEIAEAIEKSYVGTPDEPEQSGSGDCFSEKPRGSAYWIGWYFDENFPKDPILVSILRERVVAIAKERPDRAMDLFSATIGVDSGDIARPVAALLEKKAVNHEILQFALKQCRKKSWRYKPFAKLVQTKGFTGGIAAVLARDKEAMNAILDRGDSQARAALCAAARLSGDRLDPQKVARYIQDTYNVEMPDDDKVLSEAAGSYLSDGDAVARRIGLDRERSVRESAVWNPDRKHYGSVEEEVRHSQKHFGMEGTLKEAFILETSSEGEWRDRWIVLGWSGEGMAVHETCEGRIGYAKLDAGDISRVRKFVNSYRVDSLPALHHSIAASVKYSYHHLSQNDISSVCMDDPPTDARSGVSSLALHDRPEENGDGIAVYGRLVDLFVDLFAKKTLEYHYGEGFKVLIPSERAKIAAVWKQGNDLRVKVAIPGGLEHWRKVDLENGSLGKPVLPPPFEPKKSIAPSGGYLWGADDVRPYDGPRSTIIHRTDPKGLTKPSDLRIAGVAFDTKQMCLDESSGMLYAAADGNLVAVPLTEAKVEH